MSDSSPKETIEKAYAKCEGALKRYIARFVMTRSDVDDVMQETFLNVYSTGAPEKIQSPTAYIFSVARNIALKSRKRYARNDHGGLEGIEDFENLQLISNEPDVEDQVHYRAKMAAFAEAIAELPPQCRRVIILRKVLGFSHAEIADQLGIAKSTVEKHVAKGMAACLAKLRLKGYESAASDESDAYSGRKEESGT